MTNYQEKFLFIFIGFAIFIFGLLFYASRTSDSISEIDYRLHTVSPDSLKRIIIAPHIFGDEKNLVFDTVYIEERTDILSFTVALNDMYENYPGRGIAQKWAAYITLDYLKGKDITLKVVESYEGVCVFYTNTMKNPHYRCNALKPILEEIANANVPSKRRF